MALSLMKDVTVLVLICFLQKELIKEINCSGCGGTLLQEYGVIMSPNYPNNYPNNTNCTWFIKAKDGQVIDLRFKWLDTDCHDPVNVYQSGLYTTPKTFCGAHHPEELATTPIRSYHNFNTLYVTFRSDSSDTRRGFLATYWIHDCPPFTYGPEVCNNTCKCVVNNSAMCYDTNGVCSCKFGWTSSDCSVDLNECEWYQSDLCTKENQDCINTPGSWHCGCRPGLVKNATGQCQDPKQCVEKKCSYMCGVASTDPWTEVCYCPIGLRLDPDDDQTCVACEQDYYGEDCSRKCSYVSSRVQGCDTFTGQWQCKPGYGGSYCSNIDECLQAGSKALCGPHGHCHDQEGYYTCGCDPNYELLNGTCSECGRVLTDPEGVIHSQSIVSNGSFAELCNWIIRAPDNQFISIRSLPLNSKEFTHGPIRRFGFYELYSGHDLTTLIAVVSDFNSSGEIYRSTTNVMKVVLYVDVYESFLSFRYWMHECAPFTYGYFKCEKPCDCIEENSVSCNSLTGKCVCLPGWSGRNCSLDVDECALCTSQCQGTAGCPCNTTEVASCSNDQNCYNYPGTYQCVCKAGLLNETTGLCEVCPPLTYSENCSKSCDCVENNTLSCDATYGTCNCKQGWHSHDCSVDVNECWTVECPSQYSYCENLQGSYRCKCFAGLELLNNEYCKVNSSECNTSNCSPLCINVTNNEGKELCYCPLGFEFDGTSCKKCTEFTYGVNCNSACDCVRNNTKFCHHKTGRCFCTEQYEGSDCSIDIDECSSTAANYCEDHEHCVNTIGGYSCECNSGYQRDPKGQCYFQGCKFILNNATGDLQSVNYPNNYTNSLNCSWTIEVEKLHRITLSFSNYNVFPGCEDRLEIYDGLSPTDPLKGVFCSNFTRKVKSLQNNLHLRFITDGKNSDLGFSGSYFSYECLPWFYSENCSLTCECVHEHTEHCDQENGACICKNGWKSHDCSVDVDECTEFPEYCGEFTKCKNLIGSFECQCFEGLGQDTNSSSCHTLLSNHCQNSSCSGSCVRLHPSGKESVEQCYCPRGYELVGNYCRDCTNVTYGYNCQSKSSCDPENTLHCHKVTGKCFCKPGWTSDDCSTDIDECQTVKCDIRSNCINKPGGYECQCIPGYVRAPNGYCVPEVCLQSFTNETGILESPNYPSLPEKDAVCYWTISAGEHKVIQLSFTYFNIDFTCARDVLTIYDGNNTESSILKHFCDGQEAYKLYWGNPYTSSSHEMLITFAYHLSSDFTAFSASYNFLDCPDFTYKTCSKQCNCVPNNTVSCDQENGACHCKPGWTSDNCSLDINECSNPSRCSDYSDCINFDGGSECRAKQGLQFLQSSGTVQVEPGAECSQRSCSHLCAKVTRDNKTVEECYCPSGYQLIGDKCQACSNLTYGPECAFTCPCVLPNTAACDVKTGACYCNHGWVGRHCSDNPNDCLSVKCGYDQFCVDLVGGYECQCYFGFEKINGVCMFTGCGKDLTDPSGFIQNPGFPNLYWQDVQCHWNITVDQGRVIELNISRFDIPSCSTDHLDIYDGKNMAAHLLMRLCNQYSNKIIISSTNSLFVTFRSSYNIGKPFQIAYNSFDCPEWTYLSNCTIPCNCVRNNTKYCDRKTGRCVCEKGWTSDDCSLDVDECFHNPKACPDYSKCDNFDGGYECLCYDGLEKVSNISCKVSPEMSCTEKNCSHVCAKVMTSNQTFVESCYCPIGKIQDGDTCRNCPHLTYGNNCSFTCKCNENNTAYCDGHTGMCICKEGWDSSDCSHDIDECRSACHESNMMCQNTIGSYTCVCRSGYSLTAGKCVYDVCTKTLTNNVGYLESPQYPFDYGPNEHCYYTIRVQKGFVISLNFTEIKLENSLKCISDKIAIYDGPTTRDPLIGNYCANEKPGTIRSTGNSLHVEFISNSVNTYKGFHADYIGHACSNFTYGDTCSEDCSCNQTNSLFCDNLSGVCICKDGWMGLSCTDDIDECQLFGSTLCTNSHCVNKIEGYECLCEIGFVKNTTGQCQKCNQGKYGVDCQNVCQCSREGTLSCNNVDGTCRCKYGWRGSNCSEDIDECYDGTYSCRLHTTCINTLGSYLCRCNRGFVENNCTGVCEDLNECNNEQNPPCEHICINTFGGFRCSCVPGYHIDFTDRTKCTECRDGNFGTQCLQTCQCNTENSFYCKKTDGTCLCKPGWSGRHCSDVMDSPLIG